MKRHQLHYAIREKMNPELRQRIARIQAREDAEARTFLSSALSVGEVPLPIVKELARESGIFWRNVLRARRQLEVVSIGVGDYSRLRLPRFPGEPRHISDEVENLIVRSLKGRRGRRRT